MNWTTTRRILWAALLLVLLAPGVARADHDKSEKATEPGIFASLFSWVPELWDGFSVIWSESGGSLDPWGGGEKTAKPPVTETE